ncbi:hypothetical protein [Ammoniphilus resinae]|uniref:Uncharacterized protein n=1 Tax=Ammoniphilus resinae TaxID=861532 RepID=A0ABS4GW17_9BACL|nr:hypothetical protein [Ammoniphilus resinae]MBP1934446.1 hypothetical protein [Ammoniphilus resinae]
MEDENESLEKEHKRCEMTRFVIDGHELETITFSQNGHMMVPATIWDEQKQAVVLQREEDQLVLPSGKSHAALCLEDKNKWKRDELSLTTINGYSESPR